jgi:hypothetical protein
LGRIKVLIGLDLRVDHTCQPFKPRYAFGRADEVANSTNRFKDHYEIGIAVVCGSLKLKAPGLKGSLESLKLRGQSLYLAPMDWHMQGGNHSLATLPPNCRRLREDE